LTVLLAVWCSGIVVYPFLRHAGVGAARDLGAFYGTVCHQLDGRSWHLLGEPLAVCVRCTAIYVSALASLVVLLLFPGRWTHLPSMRFLLAAGTLMAADAFLNLGGVWTSTELHRVLTGGAVGAILPWYLVPLLLEALDGLRHHSSAHGDSLHVRKTE
jgi:uncharacterized membrane protein